MFLEEQPAKSNGIKARRGSNFRTALMVEVRAVLGKPLSGSRALLVNIHPPSLSVPTPYITLRPIQQQRHRSSARRQISTSLRHHDQGVDGHGGTQQMRFLGAGSHGM